MRGCERASNGLTHLYDVCVSAVIARAFAIVDRELATEKYALARVNSLFVDQYLSLSLRRACAEGKATHLVAAGRVVPFGASWHYYCASNDNAVSQSRLLIT